MEIRSAIENKQTSVTNSSVYQNVGQVKGVVHEWIDVLNDMLVNGVMNEILVNGVITDLLHIWILEALHNGELLVNNLAS